MGVKSLHKDFLGRDVHGKDEGGQSKQSFDDFEEKWAWHMDVGMKEGGTWARCATPNYNNMYRMGIMSIFNSADSQSSTQGDSNNNQ
jgi:hypothetical protein